MHQPNRVQEHYTLQEMPARIEAALQQAGFGSGRIDWTDLTVLDQFHTRGLAATKELAAGLGLTGGKSILDVGSGLGGPARYLAAVHGCHVTGIELTPLYVEIAAMLSQRTGLAERTQFVQGDALEMPFASETFDHAWTQHVAMNISEKDTLYREICRVLKPGGRVAIYDVFAGENGPVIYPTPWASEPGISFLVAPSETKLALEGAGFRLVSEVNTTEAALLWFAEMQQTPQTNPLSLGAIIGPEVRMAVGNLARNLNEGRVQVLQIIAQKD